MTKTLLYRLHAADGTLLYVGVTESLDDRLAQHDASKAWWPTVTSVETECYPDRPTALEVERRVITDELPVHNGGSRSRRLQQSQIVVQSASEALTLVRKATLDIASAHDRFERSLVRSYKTGASIAELSRATAVDGAHQFTYEGVRQLLIRRGVELRPKGRPAKS